MQPCARVVVVLATMVSYNDFNYCMEICTYVVGDNDFAVRQG